MSTGLNQSILSLPQGYVISSPRPQCCRINSMSSYHYKQLNSLRRETRLLLLHAGTDELCGSLVHASLDEKPAFDALSYTWGRPPFEHYILIEGHKFDIGPNLNGALRQLRGVNTSRALWIDA